MHSTRCTHSPILCHFFAAMCLHTFSTSKQHQLTFCYFDSYQRSLARYSTAIYSLYHRCSPHGHFHSETPPFHYETPARWLSALWSYVAFHPLCMRSISAPCSTAVRHLPCFIALYVHCYPQLYKYTEQTPQGIPTFSTPTLCGICCRLCLPTTANQRWHKARHAADSATGDSNPTPVQPRPCHHPISAFSRCLVVAQLVQQWYFLCAVRSAP